MKKEKVVITFEKWVLILIILMGGGEPKRSSDWLRLITHILK